MIDLLKSLRFPFAFRHAEPEPAREPPRPKLTKSEHFVAMVGGAFAAHERIEGAAPAAIEMSAEGIARVKDSMEPRAAARVGVTMRTCESLGERFGGAWTCMHWRGVPILHAPELDAEDEAHFRFVGP